MYNVKQLVQHHLEIAPIVDKNTKPCSTAMLESSGETAPRVSARASSSVCDCLHQMVGIVPPSITYSLPVIDEARSDARNATSSATSSGRFGRPSGIPPSESIMRCRAASVLRPVRSAISLTIPTAASVSVYPGATELTRIPFGLTSFESPLL